MITNLSLRTQLIGGFVLIALFAALVGGTGIRSIRSLDSAADVAYANEALPLESLSTIASAFNRSRVRLYSVLLSDNAAQAAEHFKYFDQYSAECDAADAALAGKFDTAEARDLFEKYRKGRAKYLQLAAETKRIFDTGKRDDAVAFVRTSLVPVASAVNDAVSKLGKMKIDQSHKANDANSASAHYAVMTMSVAIALSLVLACGIGIMLATRVTRPLASVVNALRELSRGHFGARLGIKRGDEIGQLAATMDQFADDLSGTVGVITRVAQGELGVSVTSKDAQDELSPALQRMIDSLRGMLADASALTHAAAAGQLATRADASRYQGAYREIVQGINETLDAVIGPLNVAAEYVDRIAKGDIPPKITDSYNGDFNEIKNNLNQCIEAVGALVADANVLSHAAVDGKLGVRADASRHQGDFRKIVQGVNDTLDAVIGPLNVAAEYVDRIAKGDIPPKISDSYRGDFNEIKNNLNQCIEAVNALVADANALSGAAIQGKLAARADATRHRGDFRKIVQGVNDTLDAVIGPLNVAAKYVDRIAQGDIPPKITDSYNGEFNEIKNNLNTCIESLSGLVSDMNDMSKRHDLGDIDVAMDSHHFQGAYKTMAEGVNAMVFGHIAVKKKAMACVDAFSRGDFEASLERFPGKKAFINECIERLRTNVKSFIEQMVRMSQEHDKGDIDVRIDSAKFEGAYRTMADGVNGMVAGHIAVKKKAMACVAEFGRGNFEAPLERFPGKKAFINDTVEQVRTNLRSLIADAETLVAAAVAGQYDVRADVSKHHGDFQKIVGGVNRTLDEVVLPMQKAAVEVLEVCSRLAERDLTARMHGTYKGEFERIKAALNRAAENLDREMQGVAAAAAQLTSAADQIGSASQSLAQGASEQASSLEEVSASLQEMVSMTRQNADNAQRAKEMSQSTRSAAIHGEERMASLSATIAQIKESSDQTAKIVKTIDEIAFQTNLLALNAAVEAARAGDAGRGFAVVAEEVRNLAMRSAEAARNTADLIQQSVERAEQGVDVNAQVSAALAEINGHVERVTEVMGEIAAASEQQTVGINQISTGVEQINQVTQQTAANSEESASVAEELTGQSQELNGMVSAFTLSERVTGSPRSTSSARRGKRLGHGSPGNPSRSDVDTATEDLFRF